MLNPFLDLFDAIVDLINLALFVWLIIDILIQFDVLNRNQPLIARIHAVLGSMLEPLLRPIRQFLRKLPAAFQQIDISPIILILLLNFVNNALHTWFYTVQPYDWDRVSLSQQIEHADAERKAKDTDAEIDE